MKESTKKLIKDHKKLAARLQEEIKNAACDSMRVACRELFDNNPRLKSFSWKQYTPYFNDGDECTFDVHDDIKINGLDEYAHGNDNIQNLAADRLWDDETKMFKHQEPDIEAKKIVKGIKEIMGCFDTDDFLTMFGDHAEITVTRKGVTIEPYDHQ